MGFNFYVMFAFGLIFFVLGILAFISNKKKQDGCFYKQLATFTGYSVEVSTDEDGFESEMYYPIFNYTFNNDDYTVKYHFSTNTRPFNEGDEIEILIDPENPTSYTIAGNEKNESSFFLIFVGAGILMMVVAFFV